MSSLSRQAVRILRLALVFLMACAPLFGCAQRSEPTSEKAPQIEWFRRTALRRSPAPILVGRTEDTATAVALVTRVEAVLGEGTVSRYQARRISRDEYFFCLELLTTRFSDPDAFRILLLLDEAQPSASRYQLSVYHPLDDGTGQAYTYGWRPGTGHLARSGSKLEKPTWDLVSEGVTDWTAKGMTPQKLSTIASTVGSARDVGP